jgi:hypothetical protein
MAANYFRAEIAGAELHHARPCAVRRRQNRPEIQIVRQDDVIRGCGVTIRRAPRLWCFAGYRATV